MCFHAYQLLTSALSSSSAAIILFIGLITGAVYTINNKIWYAMPLPPIHHSGWFWGIRDHQAPPVEYVLNISPQQGINKTTNTLKSRKEPSKIIYIKLRTLLQAKIQVITLNVWYWDKIHRHYHLLLSRYLKILLSKCLG